MMFKIRLIEEKDNLEIEKIIRDYIIEYGVNYEGCRLADENLDKLSLIYSEPKTAYYVAVDEDGNIVGGCGVGKIEGVENTCELQKMFCIKSVRETAVVKLLLDACLSFAKKYYNSVYLEIPQNLDREITFFEKNGFKKTNERLGDTRNNNNASYLLKFKTVVFLEEFFGEFFVELIGIIICLVAGILICSLFPKKCQEELDIEGIIGIGGGGLLIFGLLLGAIVYLFKRGKDKNS